MESKGLLIIIVVAVAALIVILSGFMLFDMGKNDGFEELGVEIRSRRVPRSELGAYIDEMALTKGLEEQFKSVPLGQRYQWEVGSSKENLGKNRYDDLLAYDHSRVKLELEPELDFNNNNNNVNGTPTEYINANYINGYNQPKRYIATQGALEHTQNDYWRLIWQQKAQIGVMLTNLFDHGKEKCFKYWPESSQQYGPYKVTKTAETTFSDHVIRKLTIEKGNERREFTHFHYTAWPDMGVPSDPTSFIAFMDKIRSLPAYADKSAPIVAHCSAGVGRTGTFLLTEIMREMAAQEEQLDFLNNLSLARKNRVDIIEKPEQYVFVHKILRQVLSKNQG